MPEFFRQAAEHCPPDRAARQRLDHREAKVMFLFENFCALIAPERLLALPRRPRALAHAGVSASLAVLNPDREEVDATGTKFGYGYKLFE
jgi:hypothetical protein